MQIQPGERQAKNFMNKIKIKTRKKLGAKLIVLVWERGEGVLLHGGKQATRGWAKVVIFL